jgi:hypothetical protein
MTILYAILIAWAILSALSALYILASLRAAGRGERGRE